MREWKAWFSSKRPEPEENQLPGEWETKCEDPLKKMIVLRCFRPDRVNFAIKKYVLDNLKAPNPQNQQDFVTSRATSFDEIYQESDPSKPIIIILSQGADPTEQLQKQAEQNEREISTISLGKG